MVALRPRCRCVRITTANGGFSFGFTDHDMPIQMDILYKPERAFDPTASTESLNLNVDNLNMGSVIGVNADEIQSQQISGGLLDDAAVVVAEIDWTSPPSDILCGETLLTGTIGEVTLDSGKFTCEVRAGNLSKLNTRRSFRFAPTCQWDFGSVECGFDLSTETYLYTVLLSPNLVTITVSETVNADREFDHGEIRFTSGDLLGTSWMVSFNVTNSFVLLHPMPINPQTGDTIVVIKGCSKRYDDGIRGCRKYGRQANFGGIPKLGNRWVRGSDYLLNPPTFSTE